MASLLLDHNLSSRLASLLERAGHTAATAFEMHLDEAADREVLLVAARAGLILVTADNDFAALHRLGAIRHAGILLIPEFRRDEMRGIAEAIVALLGAGSEIEGELYQWRTTTGWVREA